MTSKVIGGHKMIRNYLTSVFISKRLRRLFLLVVRSRFRVVGGWSVRSRGRCVRCRGILRGSVDGTHKG